MRVNRLRVTVLVRCALCVRRKGVPAAVCHKENAEKSQQHPGIKTTTNPAEDNRKRHSKPNGTKPNSNAMHPQKLHNNPSGILAAQVEGAGYAGVGWGGLGGSGWLVEAGGGGGRFLGVGWSAEGEVVGRGLKRQLGWPACDGNQVIVRHRPCVF